MRRASVGVRCAFFEGSPLDRGAQLFSEAAVSTQFESMYVVSNSVRPCSRMTRKADSGHGPCVIMSSGLDDVRSVALKRRHGLLRRADNGNVSRLVLIGIREYDEHQIAAIGLYLGRFRTRQCAPTQAGSFGAGQPF